MLGREKRGHRSGGNNPPPRLYKNILAAFDGSDGAYAALSRAAELAARDGAALTVVESVAGRLPSLAPGAPPSGRVKRSARARRELRKALKQLDDDLLASPWVVGAPPAKSILTVADDIGADLIVTGSRGRGGVTSAVLGSVSTEIVHGSSCDVLVVHPPAGEGG